MTIVHRSDGKRESGLFLWMSIFFGFTPVAAYFSVPGTRLWAVAFGAALGLPLFVLAMRRLGTQEVLRLSNDHDSFELLRGSFFGRRSRRIPVRDVRELRLDIAGLRLTLVSGEVLRMGALNTADEHRQLSLCSKVLGIPYARGTASLGPPTADDGIHA